MQLYRLGLALCLLLIRLTVGASAALPEALETAPEGSFSIAVLSDTQDYQGKGTKAEPAASGAVSNKAFQTQVDWIRANLARQRIVFVSHLGDIVDRNVAEQWQVARATIDRLHGCVAYGIAAGNHDLGGGSSTFFRQYFPVARCSSLPWYGGAFAPQNADGSDPGVSSFQSFTAGGLKFLTLHLECNAPDDVLQWADGVLAGHADCRAIVATHMWLGPKKKPKQKEEYFTGEKGRMGWKKVHGKSGNTPEQMWDKCLRKHENVFMVLCGDQSRTQAMRQVSHNDAGKPVNEVLSDYGQYWVRLYRFLPTADRIEVRTVDARNGELCPGTKLVPDRSQHQFALEYAMSAGAAVTPQAR